MPSLYGANKEAASARLHAIRQDLTPGGFARTFRRDPSDYASAR